MKLPDKRKSMMVSVNYCSIAKFWKWFEQHVPKLTCDDIPLSLVGELEEALFSIYQLDWEIGPGLHSPNYFSISPSGDRELLQVTRRIISDAPQIPGWEFYPAKPAKVWNLEFNMDVNGRIVDVDGKLWEFTIKRVILDKFDIAFKPGGNVHLSDDYLYWAATIIVDGEIGEEKRIDCIRNITMVESWDNISDVGRRRLKVGELSRLVA